MSLEGTNHRSTHLASSLGQYHQASHIEVKINVSELRTVVGKMLHTSPPSGASSQPQEMHMQAHTMTLHPTKSFSEDPSGSPQQILAHTPQGSAPSGWQCSEA